MAECRKLTCQECGCHCDSCVNNNNTIHLYREIEHLKRQLAEREYHIVQMETSIMHHAKEYPNGELEALQDSLRFWQEKYERLLEGHRKLQKVNQGLEDKLLRIVDKFETEKSALTRDVADLTTKLVDARLSITELEEENELFKNDCSIAVQLLQCKPSNFIGHKLNTLPLDLQEKVRSHFNHRRTRSSPCNNATLQQSQSQAAQNNGAKIIRVPISTFPPTAMVYSVNKFPVESSQQVESNVQNGSLSPDYVSAAIMAKILEERCKERQGRHLMKCYQCKNRRAYVQFVDQETQTNNAILNNEDYHNHYFVSRNHRQRSESSSSMESVTSYNSNTISNRSLASNETIII